MSGSSNEGALKRELARVNAKVFMLSRPTYRLV